jgi:hypothetical protein
MSEAQCIRGTSLNDIIFSDNNRNGLPNSQRFRSDELYWLRNCSSAENNRILTAAHPDVSNMIFFEQRLHHNLRDLNKITHIYPTAIITSDCASNRVGRCLRSGKDSGEARTRSTADTASRGIVFRKEDVIGPGVTWVPLRPQGFIERRGHDGVLKNDPVESIKYESVNVFASRYLL